MKEPLPPGVSAYRDRHGKTRYRFRRKGLPAQEIPCAPGDPRFDELCRAAAQGIARTRPLKVRAARIKAYRLEIKDRCVDAVTRAKWRAREFNIPFGLDRDEVLAILDKQDWRCAVSGIEFDLQRTNGNGRANPFGPSIDRIIPADGYRAGNIRIVCNIVNFAMNEWGLAPLTRLVEQMKTRNTA